MPLPTCRTDTSAASDGRTKRTAAQLIRSLALACSLALAACTSLPRTPYTAADAGASRVLDIDGLRRYADEPITEFSFEQDEETGA